MKPSRTIRYSGKQLLKSLLAGIILSFMLYSFAIASTTVTVSDSRSLNEDIQDLRTEIAELEGNYYTMINDLSVEQALAQGFTQDEHVSFAYVDKATYVAYNN